MKVKIDIDTKTFVRFGLVVMGFVVAIGAIYIAQGALWLVGISLFLALALNPPVTMLARRLPGKSRTGATAIAFLLVVGTLSTLLFFIVPPIIEQTSKFAETVPELIDKATSQRVVLDDFIDRYSLRDSFDEAIEDAKGQATAVSKQLGSVMVSAATGAVTGIVNIFLVLFMSFFMLVEGPAWMRRLWGLYEDSDKLAEHKATVDKMYRVVTGFVNGQLTVAAVGATFSFVVLLVMGLIGSLNVPVNLALPLAVIIFIMALIPMVGTTIGGLFVGFVLLLNSPLAALIFIVYFVIYQQIENNLIAPRIQAKTVELSVLSILVSVLIGVSLFGLVGGLISIPIAGCIRVLLVDYLAHTKRVREKDSRKGPLSKLVKKIKAEV